MAPHVSSPPVSIDLQTEMRSVDSLSEHPLNSRMFASLNQLELQQLADDMQRRGLQHPIEILPDGRIVCGYHRWLAAQLLGWDEVRCIVRHDLAERGEEAILEHLIADNLHRRQLDPLSHAQLYAGLRQTIRQSANADEDVELLGDLRDRVAKLIGGKSGRTLDRDLRILSQAPPEVVAAVRARQIAKKDASTVVNLSKTQQKEIAQRIAAGEEPAVVVRSYAERRTMDIRVKTLAKNLRHQLQWLARQKQALLGEHYDDWVAKALDIESQVCSLLEHPNLNSDCN